VITKGSLAFTTRGGDTSCVSELLPKSTPRQTWFVASIAARDQMSSARSPVLVQAGAPLSAVSVFVVFG
jgi:hypothetical protein